MLKVLLVAAVLFIAPPPAKNIYSFKVAGLEGGTINLAKFKGKKLLIVNTASKCGYTPQYTELEQLYQAHKDKLVVIGFPANNFKEQEPGTATDIIEVCRKNYGVTFPMAEKVSVVGDDIHPLFKYLTEEAKKIGAEEPIIKWNFTKFLVDEKGKLIAVYRSKVKPMDAEITKHLN